MGILSYENIVRSSNIILLATFSIIIITQDFKLPEPPNAF